MQWEIPRRGVEFGLGDDHVNVSEVAGQAVPQPPLINRRRGRRADATIVPVCQDSVPADGIPRGGACEDPEFPVADVPLIVEDLLMRTRALSESGAPTDAIEATLDHVTALREGRG